MTGSSYAIGTAEDYVTIKYNSGGQEQWTARHDGGGDFPNAIAVDVSGNVYVIGSSWALGSSQPDYLTVKYVQGFTPTPTTSSHRKCYTDVTSDTNTEAYSHRKATTDTSASTVGRHRPTGPGATLPPQALDLPGSDRGMRDAIFQRFLDCAQNDKPRITCA